MCAATCAWTGISAIVYGVGDDDFPKGEHPNLIDIRCEGIVRQSPQAIEISGGILMEDCKQLHTDKPNAS